MKLAQAQQISESLKADLKPYCERIEIGGSIRRKKPEVGDIELICIPKFGHVGTGQGTLFGGEVTEPANLLFQRIRAGRYEIVKMGDKYCQFGVQLIDSESINVDIFTATSRTWGYIFMIRTGPRDFSKWVVTEIKKDGFWAMNGEIFHKGTPCTIPSEDDLFFLLGLDYIEPEDRGAL